MASAMVRMVGRLVPRSWRRRAYRARAWLGLDPVAMDHFGRELFINHAFRALSFNGIDGDYAEFGSYRGTTLSLAHQAAARYGHKCHLWAYDSFQGLPAPASAADAHPKWQAGLLSASLAEFHAACGKRGVPAAAYTTVPGFFSDTIENVPVDQPPTNIALAYIDCDLHSSTRSVLKFLSPRLKHGMILAFDDYYCWSATQVAGERRAVQECFESSARWRLVPYLPIGWHGLSFVVESRTLL